MNFRMGWTRISSPLIAFLTLAFAANALIAAPPRARELYTRPVAEKFMEVGSGVRVFEQALGAKKSLEPREQALLKELKAVGRGNSPDEIAARKKLATEYHNEFVRIIDAEKLLAPKGNGGIESAPLMERVAAAAREAGQAEQLRNFERVVAHNYKNAGARSELRTAAAKFNGNDGPLVQMVNKGFESGKISSAAEMSAMKDLMNTIAASESPSGAKYAKEGETASNATGRAKCTGACKGNLKEVLEMNSVAAEEHLVPDAKQLNGTILSDGHDVSIAGMARIAKEFNSSYRAKLVAKLKAMGKLPANAEKLGLAKLESLVEAEMKEGFKSWRETTRAEVSKEYAGKLKELLAKAGIEGKQAEEFMACLPKTALASIAQYGAGVGISAAVVAAASLALTSDDTAIAHADGGAGPGKTTHEDAAPAGAGRRTSNQ